jgi:hypothetical protein
MDLYEAHHGLRALFRSYYGHMNTNRDDHCQGFMKKSHGCQR